MVPFVLCGAVASSRMLAERVTDLRKAVAPLTLLGVSYAATVWNDLHKPAAADHAVHLADWLTGRGLRFGYGSFWNASIVTASKARAMCQFGTIYVRPISPERHQIVPLPWTTDSRWFTDEPATFVVLEPGPKAAYQFGLTERELRSDVRFPPSAV